MSTFHFFIEKILSKKHHAFEQSLYHPQKVMDQKLNQWLQRFDRRLEDFKNTPAQDFFTQKEKLLTHNSHTARWEPTSGSTGKTKWIPYNQYFLDELDNMSAPWIYDLYKSYPDIKKGKHYWSLSWLPEELRNQELQNELKLFPWYKRLFMGQVMAQDPRNAYVETIDLAQKCALISILTKNVSLISVWSPTFFIRLLELLLNNYQEIVFHLSVRDLFDWCYGKQTSFILKQMESLNPKSLKDLVPLFPNLKLISCWETGPSQKWALQLKELFPDVIFQGKGLWATEGVVSIPFQKMYPLGIGGHFLEFLDKDENILQVSQLKEGDIVSPLMTTGSGLCRYHLGDKVQVTGFLHKTPSVEFLGRDNTVDLAGEKLGAQKVSEIKKVFQQKFSHLTWISLVGIGSITNPHYQLIVEGVEKEELITEFLEKELANIHHYKVARELGQLSASSVRLVDNGLKAYYELCYEKGTPDGSIKVEVLKQL
ncbi:GH3 auxin-responsive promoter family protein [Bacteriovoracaceae bacterium]|nr:GH3 auxin-responsive promoter family protein [Bacteriovoracaceae bacterium]